MVPVPTASSSSPTLSRKRLLWVACRAYYIYIYIYLEEHGREVSFIYAHINISESISVRLEEVTCTPPRAACVCESCERARLNDFSRTRCCSYSETTNGIE